MECNICFSEVNVFGSKCSSCTKTICIDCESKMEKCPYCRTKFPNWIQRFISAPSKSREQYIRSHFENETNNFEKYQQLETVFDSLMLNFFTSKFKNFRKKFNAYVLTDEDLFTLLQIGKSDIFYIAELKKPFEMVYVYVEFLEYIMEQIEDINYLEKFNFDIQSVVDIYNEQPTPVSKKIFHKTKNHSSKHTFYSKYPKNYKPCTIRKYTR